MRALHLALLGLMFVLSTGCHAKFKKYASTVGTARVQVIMTGGPYVELGKVYDEDAGLVGAVVNVVQEVRAIDQRERILNAVQVDQVNTALQQGLIETMGGGPPFALNTDPNTGPLLQLEIESYGLYVPYLGAPGEFTYTAKARVFLADGEKIYRKRLTCTAGVGDPSAGEVIFGVVNNVKELDKMTDADINRTFVDIARYCGGKFTIKMRQHAG